MRKMLAVAMVCALAVVSVAFEGPADWFLFKAAGYEISFPAEPTAQEKTVQSEIGELKLNMYMYDASKSGAGDENLLYMTNVTEYPASLISSDMKEKLPNFFRNAVDGGVKNVNGKLLSETSVDISGYPGKEIKVDFMDGKAIIKGRYFLVKNKMYMVQTITSPEKFPNASMDRFFSSFRLHTGK